MIPHLTCSGLLEKMHSFSVEHPDRIAIVDRSGKRRTTQSEWWSAIGRLSNLLRSKGSKAGDIVAIDLGKSMEHLAARYAIASIGCVSISFSDSYPDERKKEIEAISEPRFVIDEGFYEESLGCNTKVSIEAFPDSAPGIIIFTSGSTGKPKGAIHDRGIFLHLMGLMDLIDLSLENTQHAALSDFSFVASLAEVTAILGCGSTVHLIDDDTKRNPSMLTEYCRRNDMFSTVLNPNMFKALGESLGLKMYCLAGEAVRNVPVPDGAKVYNFYGSTEALMSVSDVENMSPNSYLSRLAEGSRLFILDENGDPATKGEICYSGRGVMTGYIGSSECPFSYTSEGERIYHTKDLGIQTEKGIAVIGRLDDMIKINGNRVETAEVEGAIGQIDGITGCAVKYFRNGDANYLCGYFTSDKDIDPSHIREILSSELPYYMIPQFIARVDGFTRNVNGKIVRSVLPDLRATETTYVPPENDIQRKICEAFSDVLGSERIGIDDDFVLMGGTSIKAMAVQTALDFNIKTSDILLWRTPRMISKNAEIEETDGGHHLSFDDRCPLSDAQMDTYLDDTVRLGRSTKYNNPFRIIFKRPMQYEEMESLIGKLVAAHPIMRMRIDRGGDVPMAVFDRYPTLTRGDSEHFVRPFDLSEGPLCRFLYSEDDGMTVLYADFHHLISDGSSMTVLINDLGSVISGKELGFDDGILRSIHRDRENESSGGWKRAEEYYDTLFAERGIAGTLPPDNCGNVPGTYEKIISVGRGALEKHFTQRGITAGTFFEAAFAYTLSRFVGDPSVIYCNITNGRDGLRAQNAVGMFVRTIPTITDCSDRPIWQFMDAVAKAGYEKSALGPYPSRELARRYGVTTAVTFQYSYDMAAGTDMFSVEPIPNVPVGDFGANVRISGDSFVISVSHSEKYSNEKTELFADVYDMIVRGLMDCELLSDIRITTERCIERMDAINRTEKKLRHSNFLSAFSERVRSSHDRICLSYEDRTYSFGELDRMSNAIANSLLEKGISKGDGVAFLVPRSEWYVTCIVGILKTGAAYVPLDCSYPADRISFMLSDSKPKAILVTPDTPSGKLENGDIPVIDATRCGDISAVHTDIGPNDPFCILYTSGTTGRPKGTVIGHGSVENYAEWFSESVGAGQDDVFAFYGSIGFDAHMEVIISSLISGSRTDIVPEDVRLDMDSFADFIIGRGITQVDLPTSVARIFIDLYPDIGIKCLTLGGEKFGELRHNTGYMIFDTYGPTEATISILATDVKERTSVTSVGRPISNCRIYVVDAERRRVPYGAVGELCVSGSPVSLGYLNEEGSNVGPFFDLNVGEGKKERVYATGDYFRYLPDGSLEFGGRRDEQMKIMGNRVEPAEIESVIRKIQFVTDVTVQPFTNSRNDIGLCAYVVLDKGTDGNAAPLAIRSFVSERKPSYMVPSQVVILDTIPLNVNGKVDRRSLPVPKNDAVRPKYVMPETPEQRIMCDAFSDILGTEGVGIDDDFLLLGGDSLRSIRVASSFNSTCEGKRISAMDVLRYRTPRAISAHTTCVHAKIADYDITKRCPLSDSQVAFYDYARENGVETNISAIISIDGMDRDELRSAIIRTVESHTMLRSRIVDEDGKLWNVFDRMPEIVITDDDPETLSKRFFRHFDIDKDVLSRFAISNHGNRCHLLADVSHMVFDGRSTRPFVDGVLKAYAGEDVPLDDGMLRQLAFEETVGGSLSSNDIDTIIGSFDGCDLSDPFPNVGSGNSSKGLCHVGSDIKVARVEVAAKRCDSSVGVFLSTVFGYTLGEFTSRDDIVFHFSHDGRDAADLEDSVGMFVRYVPIRLRRSDATCSDFVRKNVSPVYESMSKYVPLHKLYEHADLRPHVIFQYQHFLGDANDNDGGFEYRRVDRFEMKRVSFDVIPKGGVIEIDVLHPKYRSDDEMRGFAELFLKNLDSVLD